MQPYERRSSVLSFGLAIAMTLTAAISSANENLLANPGFDRLQRDGTPQGWQLFVMPGKDASGQIDRIAHDGDYAALLQTSTPYEREPINNWSQPLFDNFTDTTLTVSASIRTEDARNAGLWIQCFKRGQSKTLAETTTLETKPLSGSHGWTTVSAQIDPPEGTDFVMVRCILLGTGRAWFDSLTAYAQPTAERQESLTQEWDELTPQSNTEEETPAINPTDILTVSTAIQQTIRDLEQSNAELIQQIESIQSNLDTYRNELSIIHTQEPAHPLVPFEYPDDKELP